MIKGMKSGLVLLLAFLAGCSNINNKLANEGNNKFEDAAYYHLIDEFSLRGLHNFNSPLFDFSDDEVKSAYDKTSESKAEAILRDIQGDRNIRTAASIHLKKYGDKSLIIISGAAFHIYGAVNHLEDKCGAEYISITPKKLDFNEVLEFYKIFKFNSHQERIQTAREGLEIQLRRADGVVNYYGFENLKTFVSEISNFDGADNIVVGIEETGLHTLYAEKNFRAIYEILRGFIEEYKPKSILYLREGPYFPEDKAREEFLDKANNLGIPVEFVGFLM